MTGPEGDQRAVVAEVWFFAPARESEDQIRIRRIIQRKCEGEKLSFHVRRSEPVKVAGGPNAGRAFDLVKLEDARNLYTQIHRAHVVVISSSGCYIRRDPSSNPVRKKQLISLEGFIRYKAPFRLFRSPSESERFEDRIMALAAKDPANNVHDPRILPLHVFDAEREWERLGEELGMSEFRSRFGGGSIRVDRGRREWAKAKAMHGGDALKVCGVEIPRGYHWDVTRRNGDERITTTHEVWKLPGSGSYCNIYPDGYVRPGQGSGKNKSRRVWP